MTEQLKRSLANVNGSVDSTDAKRQRRDAGSQTSLSRNNRSHGHNSTRGATIEVGDTGIFASCNRGKEAKCVGELRDLLEEYADRLYGDGLPHDTSQPEEPEQNGPSSASGDIESEIQHELQDLKTQQRDSRFVNVRISVQCVLFFKARTPIDPVQLIERICRDALDDTQSARTRLVKRLTPVTLVGRATEAGLEETARQVLQPHFHAETQISRKFAIRPNLRNHSGPLNRDVIIRKVAQVVGKGHTVDLKDFDCLILVEVHEGFCGLSVVGADYERLRKFNLLEIRDAVRSKANGSLGRVSRIEEQ